MRITPAQLRALQVIEAHRLVWYEYNQDPQVVQLSRAYSRIGQTTWRVLKAKRLVERASKPTLLNHSLPYIPSALGADLLKESP